MRSLGRTLLLGTVAGTTIVLLAAGVALYTLIRAGVLEQFDRALSDKARTLASSIEQEQGKLDLEFEELDLYEFQSADRLGYLQVFSEEGAVLYRSPSLGEATLEAVAGSAVGWHAVAQRGHLPGSMARQATPCYPAQLPHGRHGRAVSITLIPRTEAQEREEDSARAGRRDRPAAAVTLVMARDTAPIDVLLFRLKLVLGFVGLLTLAVSAGVLRLVVRRSLRPIRRLAAQISHLSQERLSERIDATGVPCELHSVTGRLNELLHRLEAAFQRERAFTADVAHELRTPLAGLRLTIDVALSRLRSPENYQKALRDCLRVTAQMQAMVEKLLALAALEAGEVPVELEPVFPNDLIRSAWEPLEESAAARGLQVEWNLAAEQPLVTDAALLDLIIRNVLENAVEYTDEGGTVTIETTGGYNWVEIHVYNTGAMLSQDEADHALQRFWRGDAARSGTGIHSGLGLSLVSKTVAVLRGQVTVESRAGGRFEITLRIPSQHEQIAASG